MHHALWSGHHLTTTLTVQHLLEFRIILAASQGGALPEVDATAVREIPLASTIVVRICQGPGCRLAIIILTHACTGVDLLEGDQIRLR